MAVASPFEKQKPRRQVSAPVHDAMEVMNTGSFTAGRNELSSR